MKYFLGLLLISMMVTQLKGQVKYAHGLKIDLDAYNKVPKKATLTRGDYEKLPDSISLKLFCPKPGNQIQLNTSSSWAASYGAITILNAEANKITNTDQITNNSFSPIFNYTLSTNFKNNNCSTPSTLIGVLESPKTFGTPKYFDFLQFCPDSIPQSVYTEAEKNKITDFARIFETDDAPEFKLEAIKKSLAEGLPVIIGMYTPPSFNLASEFWQPREKLSDKFEAQALCVIGYDNHKYGGSFEVLNSWGKNWGNHGFMWIRYPDFLDFTATAFELFTIENEQNKVDFSGQIKLVLENGMTIGIHNTDIPGYYQTTDIYPTGTKFKIYISNSNTAYVYVFGTDKTNQYFPLFPNDASISPILNYKNGSIALPGENYYIQITGDPGKDFLIILYSKEEVQMNSLMNKMQHSEGTVDKRLTAILSNSIVEKENIKWDEKSINFSGQGNGKSMIPVFIEIQHK